MQRGRAGAKALRVGLIGPAGVGQWGAAGTCYRAMTAYRQLSSLWGRRLQIIGKQHKINKDISKVKQFKRNASGCRSGANPTRLREDMATLGPVPRGLNLLILLVGRGSHVKVLEELKEVTKVMQSLLQLVGRQCKLQTAERIRRGLQLYSVYSRLWGEEAARAALKSLRRILVARGKGILLSAVCFTQYDWEANKITDDSLKSAVRDLDSVGELCKATVECGDCGKRQVIDKQMTNIEYCTCDDGQLGYTDTSRVFESWEPFIERSHHIVWRKRHHVHQHLYAYKVYGTYDDVSLSAFMEVQLNSDFRTEWDDTALQLRVLSSHRESNSDLIYWLVKYPQFFSNRDYVYKRRFLWNKEKQEVVIMSEAVPPDEIIPEEKGVHRVNEYWSTMVIRAKGNANEPGLEYTLTYFDNPGTSLPQWLTNFIAVTGFPSFLEKLHNAAVSLQAIHEKGEDVYVSLPKELRYPRPILEKPAIPKLSITDEPVGEDVRLARSELADVAKSPSKEISLNNSIQKQISISESTCDATELLEHVEEPLSSKISETEMVLDVSEKVNVKDTEMGSMLGVKDSRIGGESMSPENEISSLHKTAAEVESCVDIKEMKNISKNAVEVGEAEIQMNTTKEDRLEENSTVSETTVNSAVDNALHVYRGNKKVAVDILEGMEVVAPDLDEPTIISKNIEKLTLKAIEELEKKTVLSEKLKKLRHRLKLFQQHASLKKEASIQKMYEFEKRNHYDSYDPLTRMHLDRLFEAMQEVIQADKEMRTGKGLLRSSSEDDALFDFREPFIPTFVKRMTINTEGKSSDGSFDTVSTDSLSLNEEGNERDGGNSQKKAKSKDDPPPPPPPTPPSQLLESIQTSNASSESNCGNETTSNEIETYNGMSSADNGIENSDSNSAWLPWMYVPYLSAWWESSKSDHSEETIHEDTIYEETRNIQADDRCDASEKSSTDSNSQSLTSRVWYVVGLGWMFSTKAEVSGGSENSSEESCVSRHPGNAEKDDSSGWSRYPLDSAYRFYTWAFKSTNANA